MRVKNTMRLVRAANNYINIYYDIETEHVIDIKNANTDPYAMIIDGFKFGYMQGLKAARAEQKAAKKIPSAVSIRVLKDD